MENINGKKLLAIEVVLSNLDFLRIPREHIGVFHLNGLKAIVKDKSKYWAKQLVLSVDRNYKANTLEYDVDAMGCLQNDRSISSIERIFEYGGEKDSVYFDWYGEVLYVKGGVEWYDPKYQNHNEYQRSKTNKHGDIFLEISEKAELNSIFPDEIINADDYTVGKMR